MPEAIWVSGHRQRRNVTISGRRTSLCLEESIWASLNDICARENLSLTPLISLIDQRRQHESLASALRVFVLAYFRTLFDLRAEPASTILQKAIERIDNAPRRRQAAARYRASVSSFIEESRS